VQGSKEENQRKGLVDQLTGELGPFHEGIEGGGGAKSKKKKDGD